ncbi:GuaB3 family IMP dehydrogenase-related protein [Acidimicrobiia bacterium EGI L10123]|uniref:GuaB3 family IMP dehydrogenase-related protein n=1 Tax=Salinilacustrithrix flava TaxID=2957203 RepID=UPI003D7C3251|nr:GuaB3 family IMP dehydrogenase-related protein [Acidimicrobiia bacterium EGI L10123]
MGEIEIGLGKAGRRGYGLDELTIVPSRRTRDAELVDLSWELQGYRFELPVLAAPCDSVVSPTNAASFDELGGLAVLDLEGLWSRYADPAAAFDEIADLPDETASARLRELYQQPVDHDLVVERIRAVRASGAVAAGSVTPQRIEALLPRLVEAELDMLVIRSTVLSAEHVTKTSADGGEPLNLKTFIRQLDVPVLVGSCTSYQAALHLMRTGAAAVLVGVGTAVDATTADTFGVGVPLATAIADARAARMRHLDETGVYVHLIADGGMHTGGDVARAIACGADAVMLGAPLAAASDAPGRGRHWAPVAARAEVPHSTCVRVEQHGTQREVLVGPSDSSDGRLDLMGSLRSAMALSGYESLKEFQKAELIVSPGDRRGQS